MSESSRWMVTAQNLEGEGRVQWKVDAHTALGALAQAFSEGMESSISGPFYRCGLCGNIFNVPDLAPFEGLRVKVTPCCGSMHLQRLEFIDEESHAVTD